MNEKNARLLYLGPNLTWKHNLLHCYVETIEAARLFIPNSERPDLRPLESWHSTPDHRVWGFRKPLKPYSAVGHWYVCEGGLGDDNVHGPIVYDGQSELRQPEIDSLINRRWTTIESHRMWKNEKKASKLPLRSLRAIEELTATYHALGTGGQRVRWLAEVQRLIITGNKAYRQSILDDDNE